VEAALRGAALSDMPDLKTLEKLKVPTLILAWEDDMSHPVSTAEILAETLPDVRELVVCKPDDLSDWLPAMLNFLAELEVAENV
jgi:pimeloyl-ACP methyl ester carboxylesterase